SILSSQAHTLLSSQPPPHSPPPRSTATRSTATRVEDSSNTNQWGKKEAGSSPPSSGKWAAVEN
ncbi:hypothetical protein Tco_1472373, partial [Tanacetum coccineum]